MTVRDKVSAIEFVDETGLDRHGIRAAGHRAMEAGKRFMSNTISESQVTDDFISYAIKGPGGFVTQMKMVVRWHELGQGRRRVSFSVGDFLTSQSKVMFIPISPKSAPALTSARRFAEALRAELAAA